MTLAAQELGVRGIDVGGLEGLEHPAQEGELRGLRRDQHVQLPVVQLRLRQHDHPAAVRLGVAYRDGVAGHVVELAVHGHREPRRLPGGQGPQGCVQVDGVAPDELGVIRDPVRVRVEPEAGDAEERLAVHVGDVDQPLGPLHGQLGGRERIGRDPEHASEVVAAPTGDQGQRRVGALEHGGERAQQAVAAERADGFALLDGHRGLLCGVLDAAGGHGPVGRPEAVKCLVDGRKRLQRLAPGRGRVHQQREAAAQRSATAARARSAAAAPRASPRKCACVSTFCTCARSSSSSPIRRSAWGSSRSSGSSTSRTSC